MTASAWRAGAALTVALAVLTACSATHHDTPQVAASTTVSPTTAQPVATTATPTHPAVVRHTTTHPPTPHPTPTPAHTTPRPAPSHTHPGAVAVVPHNLAHPPPAQPVVPLTLAAEEVGLVDVTSTLSLRNEIASGTGMILTSSGAVLTNNHVVRGATSVTVTVVSTGVTYNATVVGTDPSADVAVVQMVGAPAQHAAPFGDSATLAVGAAVTGVGNAGGRGGAPTAAPGVVTALHQSITATDSDGSNPENLTDLIASNAQIQPGDSGGPLFDAHAHIVGMDTASGAVAGGETVAFSIPINTARSIATAIEQGQASSTIHIGTPAFLGVTAADAGGAGAQVQQVYAGTPAAAAGLHPGDVITALGGTPIHSAADLDVALAAHKAGDQVPLAFARSGLLGSRTFTVLVTLATGPAD
jgi:S1-C subfamily serine protease